MTVNVPAFIIYLKQVGAEQNWNSKQGTNHFRGNIIK